MPSNNAKITREQREEILSLFIRGDESLAQARALHLGLEQKYPYKLARASGLMPRTGKRWGQLRESA